MFYLFRTARPAVMLSTMGPATWEDLRQARTRAGHPPRQQMIKFLNMNSTRCYSNGGTNFLFSVPEVSKMLAELSPNYRGLLGIMGGLARVYPQHVSTLHNSFLCLLEPSVSRLPRVQTL